MAPSTTPLRFASPKVLFERRADGSVLLRSPQQLGDYARCVTEWLSHWSDKAPEHIFLAERKGEAWRKLSYREAYGAVRRIGQALLERGLNGERPVAILSDNSIEHALLALGAMHVGIPAAPISPAYSLMSQDHGKLKYAQRSAGVWVVGAAVVGVVAAGVVAVGVTVTGTVDVVVSVDGLPPRATTRASRILIQAVMKSCQISAGNVPPATGPPWYSVSIGFSLSG